MTASPSAQKLDDLARLIDEIVRIAQPLRIVLFGSFARQGAEVAHDIDLLVVFGTDGDRRERRVAIRTALADLVVDKDILVATEVEAAAPRAGSGMCKPGT